MYLAVDILIYDASDTSVCVFKDLCKNVQSPISLPRPDDSAVRVDQQEWGAPGQKPVPPGHGAGGLGHPGALLRCTGCVVSP